MTDGTPASQGLPPRVWIVGAGALGVLYADTISRTLPVTLVSRRADWLRTLRAGYRVVGRTRATVAAPAFDLALATDLAHVVEPTVVIVLVSGNDLAHVCNVVEAAPKTTPLLTLQNGLAPQSDLRDRYRERCANGATYQSASLSVVDGDVVVEHWHAGHTVLGRCLSRDADLAVDAVAGRFVQGVTAWTRCDEDAVWTEVWTKSALAAAMSPLTTLVDQPVRVLADEHLRWIPTAVLGEVAALAADAGVLVDRHALEATLWDFVTRSPDAVASMTEHARAGRNLELGAITGAFLDLAQGRKVALPVLRTLHALLSYGAGLGEQHD